MGRGTESDEHRITIIRVVVVNVAVRIDIDEVVEISVSRRRPRPAHRPRRAKVNSHIECNQYNELEAKSFSIRL